MADIEHERFIVVVPIMPCPNSLWIMDSGICGEGRAQIFLSSSTTMDPLAQDPGDTESIMI